MNEQQILRILSEDYDAIFVLNSQLGTLSCLQFAEEVRCAYGSPEQFRTPEDLADLLHATVHPEDFPALALALRQPDTVLKGQPSHRLVYRSGRDGSYRYHQLKLSRLTDADGSLKTLLVFNNAEQIMWDAYSRNEELSRQVEEQTALVRQEVKRYSEVQRNVIEGMATLVEGRDLNTGQHVKHTRHYVTMILRQLRKDGTFPEITPEFEENVIMASVLHDVGKIFISDFILNKPGKLTPDEFEIIKSHTSLGAEIVNEVFASQVAPETVSVIRDIVLHHHEKWNGTGYPGKLAGDDIPLAARIMAVSDVFDALVTKRPYKAPMPMEKALGILVKDSGSHFDKRIVDAFICQREELEDYISHQSEGKSLSNMFKVFGDFEKKLQKASIINALSSDYDCVFYAEPNNDKISTIHQRPGSPLNKAVPGFPTVTDFQTFSSLTLPLLHADDSALYRERVNRDTIRNQFEKGPVSISTIRAIFDGALTYHEMKFIRIGKVDDEGFDILMGFRDVTEIEQERHRVQEVLAEAKARAENASAAKTEFVHRLSRDIRIPFTDVIGFTDKAMKHINDPQAVTEALEKVRHSENTLLSVIDRILEIEGIGITGPAPEPATAEPEAEPAAAEPEAEDDTSTALERRHILVADDNELNLEIVEMLLSECGAIVTTAENGKLALDTLTGAAPGTFDAILMDVQMPEMDGLEATRRIRSLEDERLARIPIIAMTASVFEKDRKATEEAGMSAHLSKPIDLTAVLRVLREQFSKA